MKKVTGLVLIILMAFIAVPVKSQLKFGVKVRGIKRNAIN